MKLGYDPKTDKLTVYLTAHARRGETRSDRPNVAPRYDEEGNVVAVEISNVSAVVAQHGPPKSALQPPLPAREDFWRERTLEELAQEQGVRPVARLEEILGQGASLWESDDHFERFLSDIYDGRRKGIEP